MKLRTHFLIADITARRCRLSGIRRAAFCIGSLIPDLTFTQLTHPHFFSCSGKYVLRRVKSLSGHSSIAAYLELGKMAHYASDFCCSVHLGRNIGSIREHLLYERRLNRFAVNNYRSLLKKSMQLPHSSFEDALAAFRSGSKYDFETDFLASVRACTAICASAGAPAKRTKHFWDWNCFFY